MTFSSFPSLLTTPSSDRACPDVLSDYLSHLPKVSHRPLQHPAHLRALQEEAVPKRESGPRKGF